MSLQDEIKQAAREGAQEANQPVQFPDVQNVKVTPPLEVALVEN